MLKEMGWKHMHEFMHSYFINPYEENAYKEVSAILNAIREGNQQVWEAEQEEKQRASRKNRPQVANSICISMSAIY